MMQSTYYLAPPFDKSIVQIFFTFIKRWCAKFLAGGGWGEKVLGKLTVPGRPTKLDYSKARRMYWVNLQCRGVLLNWNIVG